MLKIKLPSPITILMIVIILAAICTRLIPAGRYDTVQFAEGKMILNRQSGDSSVEANDQSLQQLGLSIPFEKFAAGDITKPVSIPGTYHSLPRNRQGLADILKAPIKGINKSIDIILFILVIGAFMAIFNESGAMSAGISALSRKMNGRESLLIIILGFLFSFAGASYGMAEEALVFYAVLVPVFLAAGYDLIVPVAVIFGGTQLGTLSSFSNPFSTIIASNAAGINWKDGFDERVLMFGITTAIYIWYVVRYAKRVKKDPARSLVKNHFTTVDTLSALPVDTAINTSLSRRNCALLVLFFATFLTMIAGVVWRGWWLEEMTALFLASSVLLALILRMNEAVFIRKFIAGAADLLGVAFIVGVARGVTVILQDGQISDSIVFYAARFVSGMPPVLFIIMTMLMFAVFTLFISSSSGMAVLTMPIMGSLAVLVHVPGREIVNAYLFGMGIMGFITPTGLILPSLALVNVTVKEWWKFIWPLLIMLLLACGLCLLAGLLIRS